MRISLGKTALLGCGLLGLLGLAVATAIVGRVVWLIVFYQPPPEQVFKTHFDFDVGRVKNLRTHYYDFNNTASIELSFEVLDGRELDAFLKREGVLLEKSQEEKTLFFKEKPSVKWWAPDKNIPHELYRMKAKSFKKSVCIGYLYFAREKKLVFAEYTLLFEESHCKDME